MTEFYVGSYAKPEDPGICRVGMDGENGAFTLLGSVDGLANPSFVLAHPNGEIVYTVEELAPKGRVTVLQRRGGKLRQVQSYSTQGADPCHICLTRDLRFLLVSNYSGGSLAVFSLDGEGRILGRTHVVMDEGRSVYPGRQDSAHVHFSADTGEEILYCDLGEDLIHSVTLDGVGRAGASGAPVRLPAGEGPRHLWFHPERKDLLYCVAEMGAHVHVIRRGEGAAELLQELSMIPEEEREDAFEVGSPGSMGAAIHPVPGTDILLASTRGHNSIASFRIREDGTLTRLAVTRLGGKTPRDFGVFGRLVVCAFQDSDRIESFVLSEDGHLEKTGHSLEIPCPVCICPR